jgi:hypothetical protein
MPVLERSIETFRRRHGHTPERARGEAELTIGRAVRAMLAGEKTALDRMPPELYAEPVDVTTTGSDATRLRLRE